MQKLCFGSLCVLLAMAGASRADVIDFENPPAGLVPNGSYIAGTAVSANAELTNQFENLGAIFTTVGGSPFAALIDLGAGHAVSGTNGIGTVDTNGNLDYTLDLDIFLVVPGTLTPAVTDAISIQGDEISIPGNVVFSAYDVNGNLVASGTQPDTPGGTYALSAAGIHEFRLHSTSGTVAYDNLSFDVPTNPDGASAVPEPATLWFSGVAGAVIIILKRRS
jgi:hypothetical protein